MKLYRVEIKTEIVVLASSTAAAEMVAQDVSRDVEFDVLALDLTTMPSGWSGDECPYREDFEDEPKNLIDKTVQQLIDDGAAPKWRARP